MNTRKHIHKALLALLLISAVGCTDKFESTNTDPYQISEESLQQDFNQIGSYYPTMLSNIFGQQIEHNLINDSYARHLATPTPFVGGINNTTYYITWNTYWNRIYDNIMSPSYQVIELAEEQGEEVFVAWAKLIRIIGASRLTAYHGPIIYSEFGSTSQSINYDSEEVLYTTFFSELDEILTTFNANLDYGKLEAFDASFGGDVSSWVKVANTLRLQLAIRISKVAPALAQTEGEKAIAEAGGLISTNADNFYISLYGAQFHPAVICFSWNDTRMSATMESILVGYKDNRISSYFEPATDASLYPDHPDYPYKGIRNGALLGSKDDRLSYSTISEDFEDVGSRRLMTATETQFLLAEAALRGWAGTGTAQEHYESGVQMSFEEWGAAGASDYLADASSLPLDYTDPKAAAGVNAFTNRIEVTVAWDEAATNEVKLEKIITQKWIAGYMNSIEAWVDHRRTGYPKLPYNYKNDSNSTWGVIAEDDFLRRMPFVTRERENNPNGVADATSKLGGPDEIGTHLWWDTGEPNF